MVTVQTAVLDLINFTLLELKRINPSLDSYEELSVENSLARSFHKLLQRELDPVWHQLSWKTKQLVADLKTLRTIMTYLTQYDCITFYNFVSALRTTENAVRSGGWMLADAAETLFLTARERVFGEDSSTGGRPSKKLKVEGGNLELKFESNPKWKSLLDVVAEVKEEVESREKKRREKGAERSFLTDKLLILTSDDRTAAQVQDLLERGEEAVMVRLYNRCLGEKHGRIPEDNGKLSNDLLEEQRVAKEPKHKGQGKKSSKPPITLTQMQPGQEEEKEDNKPRLYAPGPPAVLVQATQSCTDFELSKLINELRPRYVLMYDAEVAAVRILEVYQAR